MSDDNNQYRPTTLRAWESLSEERIQSAFSDGKFQHLPGLGKPLPDMDPSDNHWWIRQKCREEGLELLPPALELKRDVQRELERVEQDWQTHRDLKQLYRKLNDMNHMIKERNLAIGWGPASDVQPIDIPAWVEKLQATTSR